MGEKTSTNQCCDSASPSISSPSSDLRASLVRRKMQLMEQQSRIDRAIAYLDLNGEAAAEFLRNVHN